MENIPTQPASLVRRYQPILKILLVLVTMVLLGVWLFFTPPGLLGKADAAGYAVCHRISERSFFIGDRQMPLCARCSGMYLGALLGMVYLSRYGNRAGMPPLKILVVLAMFLGAFAIDGVNSYLHLFPGFEGIYEPHNWLRLVTGTGLGIGIAAILVPVLHQTVWRTYDPRPAIEGWKQFLPLLGLGVLLVLAVLSDQPLLLYPLALLSAATIFMILSMVYSVVWIMVAGRENRFTTYRELWVALVAGFMTALVQIAIIDIGRFWLTGTWSGFPL